MRTSTSNSYQSVPVDPFAFVHPQKHKLLRGFELVWLCHKQTLEDVAEVPDVELVVEVCCCLSEIGSDLFKPVSAVLFYVLRLRRPRIAIRYLIEITDYTPSIDVVPMRVELVGIHLHQQRGAHLTVQPERSFDHVA